MRYIPNTDIVKTTLDGIPCTLAVNGTDTPICLIHAADVPDAYEIDAPGGVVVVDGDEYKYQYFDAFTHRFVFEHISPQRDTCMGHGTPGVVTVF